MPDTSALDPAIAARLKRTADGLVPAVVQQHDTGEVLMLGWMDDEALARTLTTGRATYWSRSRQEYWLKGETSGQRPVGQGGPSRLRRRHPARQGRPGGRGLPHRRPHLLRRGRAARWLTRRSTRTGPARSRRTFGPVVLLAGVAGGALATAGTQPWFSSGGLPSTTARDRAWGRRRRRRVVSSAERARAGRPRVPRGGPGHPRTLPSVITVVGLSPPWAAVVSVPVCYVQVPDDVRADRRAVRREQRRGRHHRLVLDRRGGAFLGLRRVAGRRTLRARLAGDGPPLRRTLGALGGRGRRADPRISGRPSTQGHDPTS